MVKSRDDAELARRYTREAIEILVDILRDRTASRTARTAAAESLIARGWIESPTRPDDQNSPSRLQ